MLYFAYGSNMSQRRLKRRIRSAKLLSQASLPGYQLRLHKAGADGSAKADAYHTSSPDDRIHGVLYRIDPQDKPTLDKYEAAGMGYECHTVQVWLPDNSHVHAMLYIALHIDPSLKPFNWYMQHLLTGARLAHLPDDYLDALQQIETQEDPDRIRHTRELEIYTG